MVSKSERMYMFQNLVKYSQGPSAMILRMFSTMYTGRGKVMWGWVLELVILMTKHGIHVAPYMQHDYIQYVHMCLHSYSKDIVQGGNHVNTPVVFWRSNVDISDVVCVECDNVMRRVWSNTNDARQWQHYMQPYMYMCVEDAGARL